MLPLDLTGKRFGRLIAIHIIRPSHNYQTKWLCQCDCGKQKAIRVGCLQKGFTRSCGCLRVENTSAMKSTHRESTLAGLTLEYKAWREMKKRCFQRSFIQWKDYGGRGITVCDEWRNDYLKFLACMGRKPTPQHTLDRIDVNGNYEPGNCKWSTWHEQRINRRDTKRQKNEKDSVTSYIPAG